MPDQPLTGESLEQALRGGDLDRPDSEIVGMVKVTEEKGKVSFSRTDCESWVDLPTDLIKSAEQVGHSRCRDHSHPVFRLQLNSSDDPAAQVFGALLAAAPSALQASPDLTAIPPPIMSMAAQAQLGERAISGFNSQCVLGCQWSCPPGLSRELCWWICAWLCHPRVAIGGNVRL
jgi:hypothetical protein